MMEFKKHGKTSSNHSNYGQRPTLPTETDVKASTFAAELTAELNQHLNCPI